MMPERLMTAFTLGALISLPSTKMPSGAWAVTRRPVICSNSSAPSSSNSKVRAGWPTPSSVRVMESAMRKVPVRATSSPSSRPRAGIQRTGGSPDRRGARMTSSVGSATRGLAEAGAGVGAALPGGGVEGVEEGGAHGEGVDGERGEREDGVDLAELEQGRRADEPGGLGGADAGDLGVDAVAADDRDLGFGDAEAVDALLDDEPGLLDLLRSGRGPGRAAG